MAPTSERDLVTGGAESGSPTGGPNNTAQPGVENHGQQQHSGPTVDPAVDLAQAFRDLARGEQAAAAMEANLTKLESRLDELLAGFEDPETVRALLAASEGQDAPEAPAEGHRTPQTSGPDDPESKGPGAGDTTSEKSS